MAMLPTDFGRVDEEDDDEDGDRDYEVSEISFDPSEAGI
jgi:hypothetical protein